LLAYAHAQVTIIKYRGFWVPTKSSNHLKTERTDNGTKKKRSNLEGRDSTLFVNSVEKAVRILEAFDGTQTRLSLSQIAMKTQLDLSSVQRAVHTLGTLRYLVKDPATRKFELAPKLLDFSYRYLVSNELARRAIPYVQQLAQEAEETTNLTVLDDTDIVYVIRIASRFMLAPNIVVGTRIPAFCSAPGLAMLAHLPVEQAEDILDRTDFVAYTSHSYRDRASAFERLSAIREMGYVRADGEFYKGDVTTAAAILDTQGRPIGAVNISIPKSRWDPERDEKRVMNLVITAAAAISGHPR
jgi:IclR family pca regulon transcriptional regulator